MYLGWQDRWRENTEVCYRGHCFIDLPPQSAVAALNKNLLVELNESRGEKKKKRKAETEGGRWEEGGNLLTDIKWEFQPGCLSGEVTKRGCVKVRRIHS